MSEEETHRRRKSTKRRTRDSSRSHGDQRKHESSVSLQPESSTPPATVEDLRKARLNYLATPPEERRRSMKYEYVKTVKVKEAVKDGTNKDGSTVSKARSSTKSGSRRTRSKSNKLPDVKEEEDDSQYVYRTSRASEQNERMPGAFESPARGDSGEKSRRKSSSSKTSRVKTERRHTEPIIRQSSINKESSTAKAARPSLRRSTTADSDRPRSSKRRSTVPVIPEVEEVEIAPAVINTKKPPSVFGSLFTSKPQAQPVEKKVPCLTCGDEVPSAKSAKLPCTHRMCHSCLKRLFKLAVTDPAHMPPRCCTEQPISLKHVDALFNDEFKKTYNRKFKEYSTKNKIYCPARECGEWIQPKYITMDKGRKVGRCPSCKTYVCGICSQKMHKKKECPKDPATKEFAEIVKKAGWQKCYNCSSVVELKEGCNHMTCRCTAEFCMMCGLKWKSCDCPWFSYEQVDLTGDPIRFQQEMDRRREQEQHDEAIARRMQTLQVDDDQPQHFEWLNPRNTATNRVVPVVDLQDADILTTATEENQRPRGFFENLNFWGARRAQPPPPAAMPGAWDDGPQQFQQIPRRNNRDAYDPAAFDTEQYQVGGPRVAPVIQQQMHRRRASPTGPGLFEGRPVTEEEREQEQRIRAWAMGGHR